MRLRFERVAATATCLLACAASLFGGGLTITDIHGVPLTPLQPKGKASALFFITTDCPISNSYAPEIQRICSQYGPEGVSCDLIYVDPALTPHDIEKHLKDFGYTGIPASLDASQKLVKAVGATITPEVAVVNPAGQVLYRGRIDNVWAALGKRRSAATEHDLRAALEAVVSGKRVAETRTQAIGCYIPPAEIKGK